MSNSNLPAKVVDIADEKALLAVLEQDGEETQGTASTDTLREGIGTGGRPELERITVKHAGACAFELPDGDIVGGKAGLTVVVGAFTFTNSWWEKSYDSREDDDDGLPSCSSSDGVNVDGRTEQPQAPACTECPRNCDASEQAARDIAFERPREERCSNYLLLGVFRPGHELPYLMRLSSQSFKPWRKYVQSLLSKGKLQPHEVATKVTLRKVGQYASSAAVFEKLGALPPQLREAYNTEAEKLRAVLRREHLRQKGEVDDNTASAAAAAAKEANAADKGSAPL